MLPCVLQPNFSLTHLPGCMPRTHIAHLDFPRTILVEHRSKIQARIGQQLLIMDNAYLGSRCSHVGKTCSTAPYIPTLKHLARKNSSLDTAVQSGFLTVKAPGGHFSRLDRCKFLEADTKTKHQKYLCSLSICRK